MDTRFKRSVRALLAGSLVLGGALTTVMMVGGALPAPAATVIQTITVGSYPYAVSSDGTHVWVANYNDNTVSELNASTGSVIQTIPVGAKPDAVSSDGTHVWVTNGSSSTVTELNASTGAVVQTIGVGSFPAGVSSDGTHVWVANHDSNTVTEIAVPPPPTTSVIIPSNGATLSGTGATLDATASNAASVEFWLFGGSYGYSGHLIGTATLTNYGWLYSWNTTTVPNGSYVLLSVASGPGGSGSSNVNITVTN
jgi:YVTN family beta-propeller protein